MSAVYLVFGIVLQVAQIVAKEIDVWQQEHMRPKAEKAISWNMRQHLLIQTEPVKRFRAPRQNSTR